MEILTLDQIIERSKIRPDMEIFADRASELSEYWGISVEAVRKIYDDFNVRKVRRQRKFDATSFETIMQSYSDKQTLLHDNSRLMLHYHRFTKAFPVVSFIAEAQKDSIDRLRTVLDYGCGVGDYSIAFALHGYKPVLCDLAGSMIDFAAWRLRRRGIDFQTIELDAGRQYPGGLEVDAIVAGDVLEHVPNPPEAITRLHAMLVEGGYLWVPDFPFREKKVGGGHLKAAADLRLRAREVGEELFEVLGGTPKFMLRKRDDTDVPHH